jgi:hypothetical protein
VWIEVRAERTPWWTLIWPVVSWATLLLALVAGVDGVVGVAAGVALIATIFAAVYHAEVVAHRTGEPFGTLVLAVAVTVIEVALIVSVMISAPVEKAGLARDTVFAAVMIVMNGIVGLCLLWGGARYHEQEFHLHGASAALAVLAALTTLTLVVPNFVATAGPIFSTSQLVFAGIVSLTLYGAFVFGDGRAILLGEVIDRQGVRRDLQLKGAGPTPFSRRGDGRAAVGPVLREYLVSEAMAAMGVPTTRALAAATTGEPVYRERPLPGAVVTRECTTLDVNYSPCQYRSRRPGRLRSKAGVRQLDDGKDRAHGEVRAGQPAAPVYDAYDARINAERMTAPEQPKPHWRSFVSAEKA